MVELSLAVLTVAVDLTVAKVSDEQTSAEAAERRRRHRETPRRVQLTVICDVRDEVSVQIKFADESMTLAGHIVFSPFERVGHEDGIADGLNAKRAVVGWDAGIVEPSGT